MSPAALAIIFATSAVLCITLGYVVGHRRGTDAGWCAHLFDCIAKDRARRDRAGRFRSQERGGA